MTVQHKQQQDKGMFYVQDEGDILARLTYMKPDGKTIVADHTEVDDAIRHENVGYKMVQAAVEYARQHQLKIVPACPFVKAVFDKKTEYNDVLQDQ